MPEVYWRCPLLPQAESALYVAVNIVLAALFFPAAFAIPVIATIAVAGLIAYARRSGVALDPAAGRVVIRYGLLTVRVPLAQVAAAQVQRGGVKISVTGRRWTSVHLGRPGRLASWLRPPAEAEQARAGRFAAAVAAAAQVARAAQPDAAGRPAPWQRGRPVWLGGLGLVMITAAFLVQHSWADPLAGIGSFIYAGWLALGGVVATGLAVWLLLTGREPEAG